MIGTLRKHQQWLWVIIIVVTIISFVIFFSPDAKWRGLRGGADVHLINGRPVTINGQPISQSEYSRAFRETYLAYFMRSGGREWPANDEKTQRDLERDSIFRVFLLKKINELGIHVSDAAVAQLTKERLGQFPLASFEREYLQPHGLKVQDFETYMQHEVGIQQLIAAAAVSGKLLNPAEAERMFRRENEQMETEVAVFSASNFLSKVSVTPDEVARYWTNRQSAYRLPEQRVVNYVEFPASNFMAAADQAIGNITNFNAKIDEYYAKNRTNFNAGTNTAQDATEKARIKDEIRREYAVIEARRKASDFGNELMSQPQPDRADNLEKLSAAKGLPLKTSPAFDETKGLDEKFPPDFVTKAFRLSTNSPIAFSPIVGSNAVYLIALKSTTPSQIQPLDSIRDKVTADCKNDKALQMARTAGRTFHTTLTNSLAQKKTFDQACAEATVPVVKPPVFAANTTSLTNLDERVNFRMLQQLSTELKPNQPSQFVPTLDGGQIVYMKARLPVAEAKVKTDLPEYLARLRSYRQNEAFNQWFRKQAELSKLVIPSQQPEAGPVGG